MKYNRKHYTCRICGKSHYAKGYCHYHHQSYLVGRPFKFNKCKIAGCNTKVLRHIKEELCAPHYYEANKILKVGKDGGKWGYKEYKKIQKQKKRKCEKCKSSKNLRLHHIDVNPRNSKSNNLITLCNTCHLRCHSKFVRLYGKTLIEMAKENNACTTTLYCWIKKHGSPDGFVKLKRGRHLGSVKK